MTTLLIIIIMMTFAVFLLQYHHSLFEYFLHICIIIFNIAFICILIEIVLFILGVEVLLSYTILTSVSISIAFYFYCAANPNNLDRGV